MRYYLPCSRSRWPSLPPYHRTAFEDSRCRHAVSDEHHGYHWHCSPMYRLLASWNDMARMTSHPDRGWENGWVLPLSGTGGL